MSLSLHNPDATWLSPARSVPSVLPRRMSDRRKNPTIGVVDVLVMVTVVAVSAPFGPGLPAVDATADTFAVPSDCNAVMSANWVMVACGLPWELDQSTMSCWVDCQ